jgi:hypothetical protein
MMRIWLTVAATLAIAVTGLSAPATASEGPTLVDTSPSAVSMTPEVHHRQSVFDVSFVAAQSKERRFITSTLAVKDTTDRLFLGQELSCTSPSGVTTIGIETGRNFWQDGLGRTVASFILRVNEAGRWTCQSTVNLCEPGNCDSGQGSGTLTLDAGGSDPLSVMKVSPPLEEWSRSMRIVGKDYAVAPGKSLTLSKTITVGAGATPAVVAEFSFSNCIEPTYPNVCARLRSHDIDGSATGSANLTVSQVASTPGTTCTVVRATPQQGGITRTITAQQHHATFSMEIPQVALSTAPGCSNTLKISATFRSIKGNGFALEGGTPKKPTSLVSVGDMDATYQVVPVLK